MTMTEVALEDEFEAHLIAAFEAGYLKGPPPEWTNSIAMRAGTRGPIATLEEAGDSAGVSRERVRQVMTKIGPFLIGAELGNLREIAEVLVARSPVPDPIGRRLARTGLTRTTLTGAGFLNILKLVGTSPRELVGTDLVMVDEWMVRESEVPVMKALPTARKHTSSYGMTTVEEIRQALATPENPLDANDIRRVLKVEPNVRWHGEWLWVDKENDVLHSNRLVNTARSILSVNSPQTIASIHEGARRLWKFRKIDVLPSSDAMRGFFEASPYFIVDGDLVSTPEPIDYHDILGPMTAAMIDVLKATPDQIMDRRTLNETCQEAGLKPSTVGIWTTFAEWMEKIAPNVWGLRGSNPNPAVVEQIRASARLRLKGEPRRRTFSWAPDGTIEITADLTASVHASGTLTFDEAFHPPVAGKSFTLIYDGAPVGRIKVGVEHYWSWGGGKILARSVVSVGDVLRANVNLMNGTATVSVGGQELWG